MSAQRGISAEVVGPVCAVLESRGFDVARFRARSETYVPGALADAMLDAAARALGDEALGITLAANLPIVSLGPLDYAMCASSTLREALRRVSRHYAVATQRVKLTLVETPPLAALELERIGEGHSRHWIEFSLAIFAQRIRRALGGDTSFVEVTFTHDAPTDDGKHTDFFGAPVRFAAPRDRLVFAATLLPSPLLTASSVLCDILEAKLREATRGSEADDEFVTSARAAIEAAFEGGDASVDATARRMRLSRRTLQRELAKRGTSHATLLDACRRARAVRMLADGSMSAKEVAYRLGFSEPSGFFRAFRRWTGERPSSARGGKSARRT